MQTFRILLQTSVYRSFRNSFRYVLKTEVQHVKASTLGEARDKAIAQTKLAGVVPVEMSMGWPVV